MEKMNYPNKPLIDKEMKFRKKTIKALRKFKALNPWKGNIDERFEKFKKLFEELKVIYNKPELTLKHIITRHYSDSSASYYNPKIRTIVLMGRFSVVTFLHEFAHAIYGVSEEKVVKWSMSLYSKVFPEKLKKLKSVKHMVMKK